MTPPRPTELAHLLLRGHIRTGDLVIDATAGNGHDTLFLAECVGGSGRVLAFDIQAEAIESARRRIGQAGFGARVRFHHGCHTEMKTHASPGSVAAVVFNLGYLPGASHHVTTVPATTLRALEASARLIRPGGILTVVCYPGHAGGADESAAVETWMTGLPALGWRVARYGMMGTRDPSPFLLLGAKACPPE